MGMKQYQFGVLASLRAVTTAAMLFAPALQERFGQRKYPWFLLSLAARLALAPLLLGLFLRVSPWTIIVLVTAFAASANTAYALGQSWQWDYIPSEEFGHFVGRRSFWVSLTGAIFALGAACLVPQAGSPARVQVISAIFFILMATGMVGLFFHARIPEPPRRARPAGTLTKLRAALGDPTFRNWLVVMCLWNFGLAISGPFSVPYMMEGLGFKNRMAFATALSVALPAAGAVLAYRVWGRALDKRHPGKIVAVCFCFWAIIPLFYYLATPQNAPWLMGASWGIAGLFPAGVVLAVPLLTSRLSGRDKTMAVALIWVVMNFGRVIGSAFGAYVVRAHGPQAVFFVSLWVRLSAALLGFLLLVYRPHFDRAGSAGLLARPPGGR